MWTSLLITYWPWTYSIAALLDILSICINPFLRDMMCVAKDLLLVLKLGCPCKTTEITKPNIHIR